MGGALNAAGMCCSEVSTIGAEKVLSATRGRGQWNSATNECEPISAVVPITSPAVSSFARINQSDGSECTHQPENSFPEHSPTAKHLEMLGQLERDLKGLKKELPDAVGTLLDAKLKPFMTEFASAMRSTNGRHLEFAIAEIRDELSRVRKPEYDHIRIANQLRLLDRRLSSFGDALTSLRVDMRSSTLVSKSELFHMSEQRGLHVAHSYPSNAFPRIGDPRELCIIHADAHSRTEGVSSQSAVVDTEDSRKQAVKRLADARNSSRSCLQQVYKNVALPNINAVE
eukprot:GEMP01056146.1.p1 GENE.GEMP01056146.1~~GEMP01056146.1.p1  ORF type:complete len:285 (+),score=57.88 GEMP01056146.1:114-968(+)